MVPEGWTIDSFTSLIVRAAPRAIPKAKKSTYKEHGSFPVIDQGQAKVAGYVDDETLLFPGVLPVVVFGDHTRAFKYVDFPFVAGADGTQILRADTSKLDPRFFFYAVSALPLRNLGYSRHFKLLKEQRVACPPLPEQRKIAAILSSVDDAIEKTQAVIDQVGVVKKGLMQELLTRGLPGRHKKFKMTEVGEVPEEWKILGFGEVAHLHNGRAYKMDELLQMGTSPVVRIQNLKGGDKWYYSDLQLGDEKYCEDGDLLFAWSASFGPFIWHGPRAIYHYHIWKVETLPVLDPGFAYHLLASITADVKAAGHGGLGMLHMTKSGMERWRIALPPISEQREIAHVVDLVDSRIASEQTFAGQTQSMKSGLMSVLLTGEVRVTPDPAP